MRFLDESTNTDTFVRGVKNDFGIEVWSVYDFINVVFKEKLNDKFATEHFAALITERSEYRLTILLLLTYNKLASKPSFLFFSICRFNLYLFLPTVWFIQAIRAKSFPP